MITHKGYDIVEEYVKVSIYCGDCDKLCSDADDVEEAIDKIDKEGEYLCSCPRIDFPVEYKER